MQESVIKEDLSNIDLTKIAALQQKRTLAFVNHFVVTTVQFLNSFAKQCEYKLMHFERKLEKVEAALILLETRLSSIPEVRNVGLESKTAVAVEDTKVEEGISTIKEKETDHLTEVPKSEEILDTHAEPQASSYPEYDRFLKMVHVGVPLQAVKLKVSLEGLDPGVFEKLVSK